MRPQDYSTLYLDMDSFFASVEQQFDPQLRGRPVVVCPCDSDSTCVVAASLEAKRYGVQTGTKVYEARRLCPDLVLVTDSPTSYRQIHRQFMAILDDTLGRPVSRGIDEAYLLIPSYLRTAAASFQLASGIKEAIADQIGPYVTCSLGIAPNIWLAKMAANFDKPNGLFTLKQDNLAEFYEHLRLLDFTGINRRLARRLYNLGIYGPSQLYSASYGILKRALGVNGEKWYLRLRGYEIDQGVKGSMHSMGHQVTLDPADRRNSRVINATVIKICYKLAARLRQSKLRGHLMAVAMVDSDREYFGRVVRFGQATASGQKMARQAIETLLKLQRFGPIIKLVVTMSELAPDEQLSLEPFSLDRYEAIETALDQINSQYGNDTIKPGGVLNHAVVPDRIGFGNF